MALKDLIEKSKKVRTVKIHDTAIKYVELSYEHEETARASGRERAIDILGDKVADDVKEEYASLQTFYEMIKAGEGGGITELEFYSLSSEYHAELMLAIRNDMQTKVHTESGRLQREFRKRMKELSLEWDSEDEKAKAAADSLLE